MDNYSVTIEKISSFLEISSDMISIIDEKGIFLYCTPITTQITNYSQNELIGSNITQFSHPKQTSNLKKKLKLIYSRSSIMYTFRFQTKSGNYIWLESSFQLLHLESGRIEILMISREVTERKKIEKMSKEKEKNYRLMIEEAPYGIFIFKKRKWIFANKTGVKMLGAQTKKDIEGLALFDIISKEYHDSIKERLQEIYRGKTVDFQEEKWIHKNGNEIDVEVKAFPIHFEGGRAVQVIVNDISDRKKMQELMLLSEKLKTVNQLAAAISHEIKNPLTSIAGFLQLFQEGGYKEDYLEIMRSELDRTNIILDEFLTLSKPQLKQHTIFKLQDTIRHFIALFEPKTIIQNIYFDLKIDDIPIYIFGDENQLKQVFLNILKNAIEAMPNGGRIKILLKKVKHCAVISFKDQGIGISPDILKNIGQPFFTTKEVGTGLGMMVSYNIIKNHKGLIHIDSKENNGTEIKITLPLMELRS